MHVAGDVSRYSAPGSAALPHALGDRVELVVHDDTLFVVPPGDVAAAGKDHMAVFTPYFRQWERQPYPRAGAAPLAR